MYKFLAVFVLIACMCLVAEAQLTFTSSWGGKRAAIAGTVSCRNDEAIAAIYKMIQNEAERFILCQKP
ncbi:adipokinetic prohormone type 1-like [Ostrinia furnacalis]|uniref:adipokinetic prohormone type 1-like n=1 Tax=Ostrinia furnacalis TaxID=93504 RepID=UPI00103A5952|nr:adipokinetic prohormone type 1-like [Ostrinia furnacalis]